MAEEGGVELVWEGDVDLTAAAAKVLLRILQKHAARQAEVDSPTPLGSASDRSPTESAGPESPLLVGPRGVTGPTGLDVLDGPVTCPANDASPGTWLPGLGPRRLGSTTFRRPPPSGAATEVEVDLVHPSSVTPVPKAAAPSPRGDRHRNRMTDASSPTHREERHQRTQEKERRDR